MDGERLSDILIMVLKTIWTSGALFSADRTVRPMIRPRHFSLLCLFSIFSVIIVALIATQSETTTVEDAGGQKVMSNNAYLVADGPTGGRKTDRGTILSVDDATGIVRVLLETDKESIQVSFDQRKGKIEDDDGREINAGDSVKIAYFDAAEQPYPGDSIILQSE